MRPWIVMGFVAVLCVVAQARADEKQDQLKQKYDEKLKSEFLAKAAWITDYDQARQEAQKAGKPIFAYFTRSYSP